MPLPKAYTNDELKKLRDAAAAVGGRPLTPEEQSAALGRKHDPGDPLGLRRLNIPQQTLR